MEIKQCSINGKEGYKCGDNGVCHTGIDGWQKAMKDQRRQKALNYENNPAPLPESREEKEQRQEQEKAEFQLQEQQTKENIINEEKQKLKNLEKAAEDFEKEKNKPKNNP